MQQPIWEETLRPAGTSWREGRLLGGDDRALPTLGAVGRAGLAPSAPASFALAAAVGASAFLPASKPAEPADGPSASGLQPRLLEPHLHVSPPATLGHGLLPARLRVLVRHVWTFFCSVPNPLVLPISLCVWSLPFTPSPSSEPHPAVYSASDVFIQVLASFISGNSIWFFRKLGSSFFIIPHPSHVCNLVLLITSKSLNLVGRPSANPSGLILLFFLANAPTLHLLVFFCTFSSEITEEDSSRPGLKGTSGFALTGISSPLRTLQLSRTTAMPVH